MGNFVDGVGVVSESETAHMILALRGNYSFASTAAEFTYAEGLASKYRYVVNNGHYSLYDASQDVLDSIVTQAEGQLLALSSITFYGVSAVWFCVLVFGCTTFRETLNNVSVCVVCVYF